VGVQDFFNIGQQTEDIKAALERINKKLI
jgi:hypothetical protein